MQVDTPEEFLRRNGIDHKKKGSEAVLDCPACGKEHHLYLNLKTFRWHCKRCDARGNEYSLKKALGLQYDVRDATGDDPEREAVERMAREMKAVTEATDVERWTAALMSSPQAAAARAYLDERKIPLATAVRYRLGVRRGWDDCGFRLVMSQAQP